MKQKIYKITAYTITFFTISAIIVLCALTINEKSELYYLKEYFKTLPKIEVTTRQEKSPNIQEKTELEEPKIVEDTKKMLEEKQLQQDPPKEEMETITPDTNAVSITVLDSYSGKITGYGPDCYGCTSQETASGMYIGDGNIYYNDSTYGRIRIVAGDIKYPYGSIVKISENSILNEPIIAIILDRGGNVGIGKKAQFDLLYKTEKEASILGLSNAYFEILRMGY